MSVAFPSPRLCPFSYAIVTSASRHRGQIIGSPLSPASGLLPSSGFASIPIALGSTVIGSCEQQHDADFLLPSRHKGNAPPTHRRRILFPTQLHRRTYDYWISSLAPLQLWSASRVISSRLSEKHLSDEEEGEEDEVYLIYSPLIVPESFSVEEEGERREKRQ